MSKEKGSKQEEMAVVVLSIKGTSIEYKEHLFFREGVRWSAYEVGAYAHFTFGSRKIC